MSRLDIMTIIQNEKAAEFTAKENPALDAEGKKLAEHKRFTFDVTNVEVDPLR